MADSVGNPFASESTIKVDLENGLWIEIKEMLSHADTRAISNAAARMLRARPVLKDDGTTKIEMELSDTLDLEADDVETARRAIKMWNFADGKGGTAPINEVSLDALRPAIWDAIVAALNKQYAPASPAEKKS